MGWLVLGATVLFAGMSSVIYVQHLRLKACKAEYATFVAKVKTQGEAAKEAAKKQADDDRKAKEKSDAQNKRDRANLTALYNAYRSMREQRARSGYLPAPAPGSPSPERATVNRSEFNRAMEYLDERGQGIAEKGDGYRVDLDSAKEWAK